MARVEMCMQHSSISPHAEAHRGLATAYATSTGHDEGNSATRASEPARAKSKNRSDTVGNVRAEKNHIWPPYYWLDQDPTIK